MRLRYLPALKRQRIVLIRLVKRLAAAYLSRTQSQQPPPYIPAVGDVVLKLETVTLGRQLPPLPSKTTSDTLTSFFRQQAADTLASILIELAEDHDAVHDRLVRLQLSRQPKALAEAFIQVDGVFFNRADDSGGVIGDAMRTGCLLWLRAASRCESPAEAWPDRIGALVAADQYGARETLLRQADLLLSEVALRGLVASCEAQLDATTAHPSAAPTRVNWPAAQASTALSLLSEALRDPDVLVRAVLRRSPAPYPAQKASMAEAFLKYGRPEGALPWLEDSWEHLESTREHLLAQALTALGRTDEASVVRQRIFESGLAVSELHGWLDLLPPSEQVHAIGRARQLAAAHSDPVVVALPLLLDVGDDAAAEAALSRAPAALQGHNCGILVPLADTLERKDL